jgi:hypothetical protein
MTSFKRRRARLGGLLAVAIGALSIFVLPGLASARGGSDDSSSATIKSFDQTTKTLVVALPDGQSVSGLVTRRTKIRCEDERGHRRGGHGVRSREAEPGDDHGGHGEEAGDDNGSGANCTTADLVAGAAVEEIELKFRGDTVVFDEVELDE